MRGQNIISLVVRAAPCRSTAPIRPLSTYIFAHTTQRHYATHRDTKPSSSPSASSSSTPIYGQTSKSAFEGADTVGPFPLGVGSSGRSTTWKPWAELNASGKRKLQTRPIGFELRYSGANSETIGESRYNLTWRWTIRRSHSITHHRVIRQ